MLKQRQLILVPFSLIITLSGIEEVQTDVPVPKAQLGSSLALACSTVNWFVFDKHKAAAGSLRSIACSFRREVAMAFPIPCEISPFVDDRLALSIQNEPNGMLIPRRIADTAMVTSISIILIPLECFIITRHRRVPDRHNC